MQDSNKNIILIKCTDQKGLIFTISETITKYGLNIVANREFVSHDTSMFFMRTVVEGTFSMDDLKNKLQDVLPLNANVVIKKSEPKRIVVLATKESHCLGDLLIRQYANEMNAEIKAVISNHKVLKNLVKGFDIPYHFVDHKHFSREEHENLVIQIIEQYQPDIIVLAKYMRILTPNFIKKFNNKIINIHHSFLPAFIGANPYRQAYDRGVKIIGATSHFVTADLDEGPIIAQSVIPIDHTYSPKQMAQAGRDVEKVVLANALKLMLDDKIILDGNKTYIF